MRGATRLSWALALLAGFLYLLAACRTGLDRLAVWGGFFWVTLLSLIIVLPTVIPLARRRSGGEVRAGERR